LTAAGVWPNGALAAVSLTVDNLGEAAEIELGLRDAESELGGHYSVTTALPIVLEALAGAGLRATFFVEGINAEIYPEALHGIRDAGHEVAYHAWCHEDWSALDARAEVANLDRGLAALQDIGIRPAGLRPPGGRMTPRTLELLAERGLSYCSAAGSRGGLDRVAVLPFAWEAVDVFHVLPAFAALREHLTGSGEPGNAESIHASLLRSLRDARASGGHSVIVLHNWLIELELDQVRDVLAQIRAGAQQGELWVAPCCEVAAWVAEHPESFPDPPVLDETSWTAPT
jgi:peptidoglycan/xylan/chitin deacetylase (PgdA/CDA1 family)